MESEGGGQSEGFPPKKEFMRRFRTEAKHICCYKESALGQKKTHSQLILAQISQIHNRQRAVSSK